MESIINYFADIPFTDWMDIVQLLATIGVGGIAAWIAYQQIHINRQAIRLELYERRLDVYTEIRSFIIKVESKGDMSIEDLNQLIIKTHTGLFLFNSEIEEYIDKVRAVAIKIRKFNKTYDNDVDRENPKVQAKLDALIKEDYGNMEFISKQHEKLRAMFDPYLRFDNKRKKRWWRSLR